MENQGYREKTDEELVAICEQDGEAFGELARRYQRLALRTAFSVLRNRLEAEDHVQTAFCKALQHIGNFRRTAKFSTWLVRIVVNECLMELRRTRRTHSVLLDEFAPDTFCSHDVHWSPEAAVNRLMLNKIVRLEIRRIPPLLRNVFILRDVERRSMPEVAATLGISVEAAKSRLCRARAELRKRLAPHVLEHVSAKPLSTSASEYKSI